MVAVVAEPLANDRPCGAPSSAAMAKRDRRVRIAGRKLWTAIGFAACPGTKGRLYFVPRPVRFTTLTGHTWRGMVRIKIGTRTNAGFTFP